MPITPRAIIDFRLPSDFQISVGGVDITALVVSGEISKPEFNPSVTRGGDFDPPLLLWEGSLTIRQTRTDNRGVMGGPVIQIDAAQNPNFKAWVAPVVIIAEEQTICTVRLAKDTRVDLNGQAVLELKHLAYSLKGQTPKVIKVFSRVGLQQFYGEGLSFNVRTASDYAKSILQKAVDSNGDIVYDSANIDFSNAGSNFLSNTFDFGGAPAINGFSAAQPGGDETPVEKANKILFSAYQQCLESGADERLYLSNPFPTAPGVPIMSLAPQQLFRANPLDIDAEDEDEEGNNANRVVVRSRVVRVNKSLPPPSQRLPDAAGVDDNDDPEEWPKVIRTPGIAPGTTDTPLIVEIRTENEPQDLTTAGTVFVKEQSITVTAATFHIIQSGTDTTFITRESTTKTERFAINRIPAVLNRKPIETVETSQVLLHDLNRDRFEGDLTQVQQTITESWEHNTLGAVTTYQKNTVVPRQAALAAAATGDNSPVTALREGFTRVLLRQGIYKQYVEVPFRLIPQGQIDETDTDTLVSDPDFNVAENIRIAKDVAAPQPTLAEEAVSYVLDSAEVEFDDEAPNPRSYRTRTTSATKENAQRTAEVLGATIQQRRQALSIEHPVTSLYDYRCFRCINLDNGREAIQGHIVGPRLAFDNRSIRLSYTAYKLGELTSRITLPKLPVTPSQFGGSLAIAALSDHTNTAAFVAGTPIIPITLAAFNGQAPYSFSSPDLPAGLSISGQQISGTPITPVTGTATITVTDGNLDTADTTLIFAVIAQPTVTPHYRQLWRSESDAIDISSEFTGIFVALTATVAETGFTGTESSALAKRLTTSAAESGFVGTDFAVAARKLTATVAETGFVGAEAVTAKNDDLTTLLSELRAAAISAGGTGLNNWAIWISDEYATDTASNQGGLGGDLDGTSHSPVIVSNALNSRNAWDFNGSSHFLEGAALDFSAGESSLFAFLNPDVVHTGVFASVYRGTAQADNQFQHAVLNTGNWLIRHFSPAATTWRDFSGQGSYTAGNDTLVSTIAESTNIAAYINGTALTGAANNGSYTGINIDSAFDLIIGAQQGSSGDITQEQTFFNGRIYLIAICDLDLDSAASGSFATARERTESAINDYYGL